MFPQIHGIVSSGKAGLPFPRPLVWYDNTSLQGDNRWLNIGTGGSAYDFDVVNNGGDLSQESFSGLTVLQNNNAGYLTSSNYPAESTPGNTFIVAKINAFGFNMNIITEAGNSTFVSVTLSSRWRAMLGGFVEVAGASTSLPVIIVIDWIDSAEFQIEVVGLGTGSVNNGTSTDLTFNTMLADTAGTANYDGWIGENMYFDSILDSPTRADVIAYLQEKWFNLLSFVADQNTITPSITLSSGTADWLVVEDDGAEFTYNTAGFSHTRTDPGPVVVTLRNTDALASSMTRIEFQADGITSMVGSAGTLSYYKKFTALSRLRLDANTTLVVTGSLGDLPDNMTQLFINNTASVITGSFGNLPAAMALVYLASTPSIIVSSIVDLPATMVELRLNSTPSTITGSLTDLPAGMIDIRLDNTSSTITGSLVDLQAAFRLLFLNNTSSTITGNDTGSPTATELVAAYVQSTTYTAAQLDTLVQYIYTYRAEWTDASPILNIGGTNPAPGGIYQYAPTPSTGKEYIYALENDDDGEGFTIWAITYTV